MWKRQWQHCGMKLRGWTGHWEGKMYLFAVSQVTKKGEKWKKWGFNSLVVWAVWRWVSVLCCRFRLGSTRSLASPGWWHVKGHHGHVPSGWLTLLMSIPVSSSLETDADNSKGKQTWDHWHLCKGLVNFAKHSILLLTTASLFITLLALLLLSYKFWGQMGPKCPLTQSTFPPLCVTSCKCHILLLQSDKSLLPSDHGDGGRHD